MKTVRLTQVGLAAQVSQPSQELLPVFADQGPATLNFPRVKLQQPLISALAQFFGEEDAALFKCLADGGQAIGRPVLVILR